MGLGRDVVAGKQTSTARYRIKAVALGVSLVLSALLTAAILRSPNLHWLAWFSFLPLFVVVRWLRPMMAALAGGLWGACLYLFAAESLTREAEALASAIGPSAGLLALLIVIPAVYVGLAARRGQAIGFKLVTLALGWTLVEVVIHLFNESRSHNGLLAGSQVEGSQFHWLARLLGYICTALVVACANASLIGIVSGIRLSIPIYLPLGGSRCTAEWIPSQGVLPIQSWAFRQTYPRAPPISSAATTQDVVGDALRSKLSLRGRWCVRNAPYRTRRVDWKLAETHNPTRSSDLSPGLGRV